MEMQFKVCEGRHMERDGEDIVSASIKEMKRIARADCRLFYSGKTRFTINATRDGKVIATRSF